MSLLTVTNIYRQLFKVWAILFKYWLIQRIKSLHTDLKIIYNLLLQEKNIKKERKEKRIKELIYASIIVRTLGHKNFS